MRWPKWTICIALMQLPCVALHAQAAPNGDAEAGNDRGDKIIYVYGRAEKRIGTASSASEGSIAGADLNVRPLLRPGELLEGTPGLVATQHSGGGKANQFFLRGFNLDHGTDFSAYLDDMPLNFRTHGHGQGYLDVNGLIPETVERIDYRKGPYQADRGDFSFVGSTGIKTHDRMEPFGAIEVGQYGYRRFVTGGSAKVGPGDLLLAVQMKHNNGPWELPEDFLGTSGYVKYSLPVGTGTLRVTANIYHATWAPTEQLPERLIGTELCEDRYCSLDSDLRGITKREIFTVGYTDKDWRLTGWAQHYDWSLLSNFTYFLDDPVNGDEVRQYEARWSFGGRAERTLRASADLRFTVGTELRYDKVDPVGLDHTVMGRKLNTVNAFSVDEASAALYATSSWRPINGLELIGALRADWYRFQVAPLAGANGWGGRVNAHVVSPKFGANLELAHGLAIYANWGEGFHSNDARGVTNPSDPAPGLVEGAMKEIGVRFERGPFVLSAVHWWSSIGSELLYVGDTGAVEPGNPGVRHGYELTGFIRPLPWLAIDGVFSAATARFSDLPEGSNFVPGALESSGEIGVSAIFPEFNAAARLRYLGPHPLIEDNSQRGEKTLLANLRFAWTPQALKGWEFSGELLNAFNSRADDIDYYYETRFPGEPPEGVLGRNSRIVEPRQVRIGIKKRF